VAAAVSRCTDTIDGTTRKVGATIPEAGQSWKTVLREQGNRLTPQRELVLQAVEQLGHATADDIHRAVAAQDPTLNLSTIYRTLALLTELGVIRQVNLADRSTVYHSKAMPAHVHLVCSRCGDVTDARPDDFGALALTLVRTYGFDTDLERLVVNGTCRDCRREVGEGEAGTPA
jgi:Fur family transcriptional regulator, ferric uptake regulator